jgi:hypothetical protein
MVAIRLVAVPGAHMGVGILLGAGNSGHPRETIPSDCPAFGVLTLNGNCEVHLSAGERRVMVVVSSSF